MSDIVHMRLSNFVKGRVQKYEKIEKGLMYDPDSPSAARRAEGMAKRARNLGVDYIVEDHGSHRKIVFRGPRRLVRRVLDPTYTSTRRSSSHKRNSTRRNRSSRRS